MARRYRAAAVLSGWTGCDGKGDALGRARLHSAAGWGRVLFPEVARRPGQQTAKPRILGGPPAPVRGPAGWRPPLRLRRDQSPLPNIRERP
ncbi:MAG: hypothetical protein ACOVME_09715, partial [Rhodobacter sp.]